MRRRAFIAGLSSGVARWLLSAMPAVAQQKIARIGVLTPGGSDRTPSVEAFRKALQELGYIEGRSIILDFRFAKGHNEAVVLPNGMFWDRRATIVALAAAARVPAIYPSREFADDGGLIAYGPNVPDAYRRAAYYVDRVLRGAKAGDLPIQEASNFDFVVNLHTARLFKLLPSPDFLVGAIEIIE